MTSSNRLIALCRREEKHIMCSLSRKPKISAPKYLGEEKTNTERGVNEID